MSHVANWFKDAENRINSRELQILKDRIDSNITPKNAAKSLTKNIRMDKNYRSEIYSISDNIIALAISSLDSTIQKELVKLLLAIRNRRKPFLNPKYLRSPSDILFEIGEKYWRYMEM